MLRVNANNRLGPSCLTDSSGAENSLPRATPRIHGVAQTLSRDMLQMIFEYLAGDTASILSILGTCHQWRSIASSVSGLFRGTAAWDVWPTYLLNSWTDWTRDQLVSVKLGGLALRRLSHEPRFLRVLKYGQQNWEHLDIEVLVPDDPAEARALQDNLQSLLSHSLPKLRTLRICWNDSIAPEAPMLHVQPRHFLAIERLYLERVMLLFHAPHQQGLDLSSLSCLSTVILHSIAARRQIWELYLAALQRVPAFVRVALIQESVGGSALMLEDISFRGSKP
ncbi:hypothetical protein DL93DRAFT_2095189 [Clavulina sp. PMI_390]|nr:hypothetical protein DL93DRAFT_2095189 [Clavulina sp. PMI_390]